MRKSHYGLTWWHDAVYHEVGHYFELSRSANVRISWSRPTEGAAVLGTSCIVYYIVIYKDLRSLFKLNLIDQKLSFNLHCRETILNSESMSRFAIVINRPLPCSHYYSIRLFANLNTKWNEFDYSLCRIIFNYHKQQLQQPYRWIAYMNKYLVFIWKQIPEDNSIYGVIYSGFI